MTDRDFRERLYRAISDASVALRLLADGIRCHVEPSALSDRADDQVRDVLDRMARLGNRLGKAAFRLRFPDGKPDDPAAGPEDAM